MKKKHKKLLVRIVSAAVLYIAAAIALSIVEPPRVVELLVYLVPYFIVGYDVLLKAARNIRRGRVFDENFLMCIATVGAFVIGEYLEAVFVMLFYQVGELFQSIAVGKSRRSIASLMDIKPDEARVVRNGQEIIVAPEDVEIGEYVIVRAGEKIPLDGVVEIGSAELDCKALTGESMPRYVESGNRVTGGCIDINGTLKIKATSRYEDSTVSKILELVENASSLKARTDRFITRFASYYTPFVVISALLLFLIPSFITGDFSEWLGRALIFLVISCPCALVISVPLSYFGGIGASSKNGILVKGAVYLEALADVTCVVFDKTGTLTNGSFKVSEEKDFYNGGELYKIAYSVERESNHPVARAICQYCEGRTDGAYELTSVNESIGMGVFALINGKRCFVGNERMLKAQNIEFIPIEKNGNVVYVGVEEQIIGYFVVSDEVKKDARESVEALRALGVKKTVMLSGDKSECVSEVADALNIDCAIGELMPDGKVSQLEALLAHVPDGKKLAYVGDGINDAPVLGRADVGISMGAIGSDVAIEAADVVIMDDDPMKITGAVRIAKATKRIVIENIVFALGVKLAFMLLGALDIANLWAAVFADVGVSVIAILNSMRTLTLKAKTK